MLVICSLLRVRDHTLYTHARGKVVVLYQYLIFMKVDRMLTVFEVNNKKHLLNSFFS